MHLYLADCAPPATAAARQQALAPLTDCASISLNCCSVMVWLGNPALAARARMASTSAGVGSAAALAAGAAGKRGKATCARQVTRRACLPPSRPLPNSGQTHPPAPPGERGLGGGLGTTRGRGGARGRN